MNRRNNKKKEVSDRKRLHEILDLVLDINGLQESKQDITGNHPTTFLYFSGHVGAIMVDVHPNGWSADKTAEISLESTVYKDFRNNLPAVVKKLRGVANGTD